ncbi:MAG: flagellar hook-length control protein FliK [Alphaproteobacteria bacterium]|nr:flagellar hook-length control protein FliK [Alphaproteobacteria bacterium]
MILVEATLSGKDDGSAIGRPGWQHRSQELPPESAAEEDREPGAFLEAADANPAIVISAGDSIEIQDGASAVRESSPARQIISRLAEMSNSEAHPTQPTLRIKLSPEYLGHVEIVLRGQGRALKLRIEAESGLAAELLLQDKEELGRAIRRHGLGLPDEMIVITQREATETSPLGQQSTDWRPGQDPGFGSKNHRSRQHQDASEALPEGRGKGGSGHANLSTTESSSFHRPGRFV